MILCIGYTDFVFVVPCLSYTEVASIQWEGLTHPPGGDDKAFQKYQKLFHKNNTQCDS